MQSVKRTGAQEFERRTSQTLNTPPHRADASDPLTLGRPAFPLSGGSPAVLPPFARRRRIRRIFCFAGKMQRIRFRSPLKSGFRCARRATPTCAVRAFDPLDVREPPGNAAHQVPLPTKTRVLVRKASRGDARGAGLWPTGVRESLENAADEVPQPLKSGF